MRTETARPIACGRVARYSGLMAALSRRALLVFLPAVLAGCTHYVPPLSGPTAKLRFVTSPGLRTEVHALPAEAHCLDPAGSLVAVLGEQVEGRGQGRSQGMPLADALPPRSMSEISIAAGAPFAARVAASKGPGPAGEGWSYPPCVRGFTLVAREGEYYEALLEQFRSGCQLNVFRLSRERDGSYVRRVAPQARELKPCRR